MREWIREHPWRLEIVPMALIVYTSLMPVLFRGAMHRTGEGWHGFTGYEVRLLECLASLLGMMALWLVGLSTNHSLAHVEAARRSWRSTMTVALMGFPVAGLLPAIGSVPAGLIWMGVLLAGLALQSVMERALPFVPHAAFSENTDLAPPIRAGEPPYYAEQRMPWIVFAVAPVMGSALFIFSWLGFGKWWVGVPIAFLPLLPLWTAKERYAITKERVFVQVGGTRASIPIADIIECGVAECDCIAEDEKPSSEGPAAKCLVSDLTRKGPYVTVKTNNGKSYVLGFARPTFACALINEAITAKKRDMN